MPQGNNSTVCVQSMETAEDVSHPASTTICLNFLSGATEEEKRHKGLKIEKIHRRLRNNGKRALSEKGESFHFSGVPGRWDDWPAPDTGSRITGRKLTQCPQKTKVCFISTSSFSSVVHPSHRCHQAQSVIGMATAGSIQRGHPGVRGQVL